MSKIQVDSIVNKDDNGSPNFPYGATFLGNITGVAASFTGNVSVAGTLTYEDVTNVDSIGLVTARTGVRVDAGGLVISGVSTFNSEIKPKGVIENVAAATTYTSGGALVLELDVRNSTTYRYTMVGGNIGIVSFKNMPADIENGSTVTVLFTQQSSTPSGAGNTTAATGIGTNCTVIPLVNGSAIAGISTRALVGSATTVTLSTTANDVDFVSFFVHYTGGTSSAAASYKVYATKNGGFRQGSVGV